MYQHMAKRTTKPVLFSESVQPEIKVTVNLEDMVEYGFTAGELTCIEGTHSVLTDLVHYLGVRTYLMFHQDTVYIDGGYDANPYRIARYARLMEVNEYEVLKHVFISRAFTVHQLSMLIQESLEQVVQQQEPLTVIVGGFPFLYSDGDVPITEAKQLLINDLTALKTLAQQHQLIVVVTNDESKRVHPLCQHEIRNHVDARVFLPDALVKPMTRAKHKRSSYVTDGQMQLEQFYKVM